MSNWTEAAETALRQIRDTDGIPYEFERMTCDEKQLPDTYLTFALVSNPGAAYADGRERATTPRVQVSLFYRKKSAFLAFPPKIIGQFTQNGFTRAGEGPIPYQVTTGHHGWRCDFYFYERR